MNLYPILEAIESKLVSAPDIGTAMNINNIEIAEILNPDSNRSPWIGIYPGNINNEPRTLGPGNYEATPTVQIIVMVANVKSARECLTNLEIVKNLVTSILKNDATKLNNTIDIISSFSEEYLQNNDERYGRHFQSVAITLNLEVDNT